MDFVDFALQVVDFANYTVDFVAVTGFRGFREFRFLGRPGCELLVTYLLFVDGGLEKQSLPISRDEDIQSVLDVVVVDF